MDYGLTAWNIDKERMSWMYHKKRDREMEKDIWI
jgi:hypothetical protein